MSGQLKWGIKLSIKSREDYSRIVSLEKLISYVKDSYLNYPYMASSVGELLLFENQY